MPELPEVETTAHAIEKNLRGLTIRDVWTDYGGIIHRGKPHIKNSEYFKFFKKNIVGKKILGAKRRAKNVLILLAGNRTILVHMKMTGHLLYGKYKKNLKLNLKINGKKLKARSWTAVGAGPLRDDSYNQFIHLVFTLSNGKHLVLSDMRKFAKVCLIAGDAFKSSELKHLGPEPLDKKFNLKMFALRLLQKPNGKIKQVLMDQEIVSGIGNIYSDEILWASDVRPERAVKNLKNWEIKKIFGNTKKILKKGVLLGGDSMSDYRNLDGKRGRFQYEHRAYRRTGERCQKNHCRGIIKRTVVGGRSAHFCPIHQK